jgi:uncharacterized cofD-like protein
MNHFKWLYPGLKVKRWLVIAMLGILILGAGLALLVANLLPLNQYLLLIWGERILGGFSRYPGAVVLLIVGVAGIVYGLEKAFKSVVFTLAPEDQGRLAEVLYTRRYLNRGPRIVVIGGGTGLPLLLRGLKKYTCNLTAVVSVADDGGSSGRLRDDLGILPPGDIRNCLVALADKESLMEGLFQYRFSVGELAGHNLGNLLIAAMNDLEGGFNQAIHSLSRVLAVRGRVLPATLEDVSLGAEYQDGKIIYGESNIPQYGKPIKRIFLEPESCQPLPEAMEAFAEADAIIIGPGSLYTSILPGLMVDGMAEAIEKSKALKLYICNIMTQVGETEGYTASQHVKAIIRHVGPILDCVLLNREEISRPVRDRYAREGSIPVENDIKEIEKQGLEAVADFLLAKGEVVRHDQDILAQKIFKLILR